MKPIKKILITGVAGFLGSNLLDKLIDEGHKVIGIDNLSTGKLENIEDHLNNPEFKFFKRDISIQSELDDLPEKIDCIVHMAALKIPRYGNAIDTLKVNAHGAENVLELARKIDCKCVIASTSDVYGRNPDIPFSETHDSVLGPSKVARWGYAVSKLFDEHLAFAYQDAFGIPVTVLRIFGSYGPREALSWLGGPQSVFIDAVLNDEEIPIHGDGNQTRTFTYMSDTIEGIYSAIIRTEANGEILNIGGNSEISILELAQLIIRLTNTTSTPKLKYVPYESFTGKKYEDVMRRVPDLKHSEKVLNFRATVDLEQGLRHTIDWHRSIKKKKK